MHRHSIHYIVDSIHKTALYYRFVFVSATCSIRHEIHTAPHSHSSSSNSEKAHTFRMCFGGAFDSLLTTKSPLFNDREKKERERERKRARATKSEQLSEKEDFVFLLKPHTN